MKLDINQSHSVKIDPALQWQDTGVEIAPGEEYTFSATGHWVDMYIITDANGYSGKWIMPKAEKKRAPDFNWLALMGSLEREDAGCFFIGKEKKIIFDHAGTLSCFANDMKTGGFFLKNNWGHVTLSVMRIK